MKALSAATFSAAIFLAVACSTEKTPAGDTTAGAAGIPKPSSTAEGMLAVPGGHIWYRRSGRGVGTPMVLLHGGPGAGSFYLKPFEDIGDDRAVIRYDQLGAGKVGPPHRYEHDEHRAASDEFYHKFVFMHPREGRRGVHHGRVWRSNVQLHAGCVRVRRHRNAEELRSRRGSQARRDCAVSTAPRRVSS